MPARRHVREREHAIHTLEALGFQLAAVSFFLSPTLWIFFVRCATQLTFAHPRDIDEDRFLGRWLLMVVFFNAGGPLIHTVYGAEENTAFMLDFVGLGYRPNKATLLSLDFIFMLLQVILVCISYESDIACGAPDGVLDLLAPTELVLATPEPDALTISGDEVDGKPCVAAVSSPYILDLRLSSILTRIRNPPPRTTTQTNIGGLPLPNTARVQALRAAFTRRAQQRRMQARQQGQSTQTLPGGTETID